MKNASCAPLVVRLSLASAWVREAPCVLRQPICKRPGLVAELTLFTLRLFLRHSSRITFRFVQAQGWSLNVRLLPRLQSLRQREVKETQESKGAEDDSVLGLVGRGEADWTEADMYLDQRRVAKFPHLGITVPASQIIVYKRLSSDNSAALTLDSVYNWRIYALFLGLVLILGLLHTLFQPKSSPFFSHLPKLGNLTLLQSLAAAICGAQYGLLRSLVCRISQISLF